MSKQIYSDHYEIQALIAEGGMGSVYKAWDNRLEIVVALKVVHSHLSRDTDFVERFRDEARKTARLRGHANIVQIFSVENDQGTEYLVMEYFPSTNLRDQLRMQGKVSIRDAVNVTRQIAQALSYTHSTDIIHRDIKPANILLDSDQNVKLTDFGIAKALNEAPLTSTGQLIGTIKYMSPEQARNTILDGRTDLYSLGMVFHEMVTGENLWHDVPNLAIYGNLQAESTIPPLKLPPDIPQEIQGVIQDLLRFQANDRIQTAESLIARLEDLRPIWSQSPLGAEDSEATIVKPPPEEPIIPEDDETVAVLHPSSSGPSGQKPPVQADTPFPQPKKSSIKKEDRLHFPNSVNEEQTINSSSSNTKKSVRNLVFTTISSLFFVGVYLWAPWNDVSLVHQENVSTEIASGLTNEESLVDRKNQKAAEEARIAQEQAQAAEEARIAQEQAQAAEEARIAQEQAQAAEEARIAQEQAQAAEEARIAQEQAQAAEEARIAQEQAQAAEEARIAQEQAQAAEEARIAQEQAQAAEEARIAQEQAQAAEEARIAQEQAQAAEEARIAQEQAQAAEEARIAQEQAQAAEEARIAQEQAQAAEEARIAQEQAQAAEEARIAQEQAQAAEEARIAQEQAQAAEEARIAQEQAQAAEEARIAQEQAQAAEEARIAQEQAQAAEEARIAQEQAQAAEEARIAQEQAQAAEEARIAQEQAQAAEEARIAQEQAQAAETQALRNLLNELQQSIGKQDLVALKKMSTMSASRLRMLKELFARYQTIETSIGDLVQADDKAMVILQFTKFIRPNGEIVQPSRFLKTTKVVIPKKANGWGPLNW